MTVSDTRRIRLWNDRVDTEVEIAGNGPPLVYLHGPWGLAPDRGFIALFRVEVALPVHAPRTTHYSP